MDILVVLLLFLLKSFVVEGESVSPAPGIELPQSTSTELPHESLHLAIMEDGLVMSGELVADRETLENGDHLWIEPLGKRLQEMGLRLDDLSARRGESHTDRRVTVQGDVDLPFQILERVMYTLGESGFEDISLAVIKTS
jgi:biopolymer transport protein ExbD